MDMLFQQLAAILAYHSHYNKIRQFQATILVMLAAIWLMSLPIMKVAGQDDEQMYGTICVAQWVPIDMLFQQLAVCITQVIGPDSETTSNVTSGEVGKLIQ